MTAVEKLLEHDSGLLVNLKELFLTGCMSQHKKILMSFVIMWNQSFGCLEALEYPEDLREALITLRFSIDIQLPGLLDIETEEVMNNNDTQSSIGCLYVLGSDVANAL